MKDKDFQQLVDHELSQLTWSDQQHMDTLRKMQKEERPVMKRKLSIVIIAVALLLTLTGTAVAAGLNITTLKEFFDRYTAEWSSYGYKPLVLNESNVVNPKSYRHTSALVNVTVDQMYLTDEAFYLTIQYSPKQPDTLLFGGSITSIDLEGKEYQYYHLWDTDQQLLQTASLSVCDLNGTDDPVYSNYSDTIRDPETGAITEMNVFRHPEKLAHIKTRGRHTMMLRFQVVNLRNHDVEWNALFIDLPSMDVTEGDTVFTR